MQPDPTPARERPGLPLWIKILLLLGAVALLLGVLLTLVPLAVLFWLMGSGDQVDTRAVASADSLAVLHFEPHLDDPGVAAMLDYLGHTLPEFQARMRQAQGYPEWMAQLEAMRNARNTEAGLSTMMPTQLTATVEPSDPDDPLAQDSTLMGAVNMPSWARGIKLAMSLAARTQDSVAADNPEVQAVRRVEVGGHTLFVQRSSTGESFWGAVDNTLLGGAGSFDAMVLAMERMDAGESEPLSEQLQSAVDLLGDGSWEMWGAMVHQPQAVETLWPDVGPDEQLSEAQAEMLEAIIEDGAGEIPPELDGEAGAEPYPQPEHSCLAHLPGAQAVAFGMDVVGADEVLVRGVVGLEPGTSPDEARLCLEEICSGWSAQVEDSELQLNCSYEQPGAAAVADYRVVNIKAFLEAAIVEIEQETANRQHPQLPPGLEDLPELEGLGY